MTRRPQPGACDVSLRLASVSEDVIFSNLDEFCEAIGMADCDPQSRLAVTWYLSRRQGPDGVAHFGLWRDDDGDWHAEVESVAYWSSRYEMLARRARRAYAKAHPADSQRARTELTPQQRAHLDAVHEETAANRELRRAERLASRPAEPVIETRKCADCGKKAARLGDLCKRCAYTAGLMPKGKIGS